MCNQNSCSSGVPLYSCSKTSPYIISGFSNKINYDNSHVLGLDRAHIKLTHIVESNLYACLILLMIINSILPTSDFNSFTHGNMNALSIFANDALNNNWKPQFNDSYSNYDN